MLECALVYTLGVARKCADVVYVHDFEAGNLRDGREKGLEHLKRSARSWRRNRGCFGATLSVPGEKRGKKIRRIRLRTFSLRPRFYQRKEILNAHGLSVWRRGKDQFPITD